MYCHSLSVFAARVCRHFIFSVKLASWTLRNSPRTLIVHHDLCPICVSDESSRSWANPLSPNPGVLRRCHPGMTQKYIASFIRTVSLNVSGYPPNLVEG